nr:hypothetical protein Iba_chr01bCG6840 [Ipomoea batatas]
MCLMGVPLTPNRMGKITMMTMDASFFFPFVECYVSG